MPGPPTPWTWGCLGFSDEVCPAGVRHLGWAMAKAPVISVLGYILAWSQAQMHTIFVRSRQVLQGITVSWEVSWVIIGCNWLSQQLKQSLP